SKRELNDNIYSLKEQSEREVLLKSEELIKSHPGLILINFPARNLDRILIYYELAKRFHRYFAITPKIFLFLQYIRSYFEKLNENESKQFKAAYKLPEINSENIIVYLPRRSWGKFELIDYKKFEKKIFNEKNYITYKEIKKEPEKYLLYLDFFMLNELIDLDQNPGTVMYLNSTTDPFSEEMELQEDKLNAWLERFGIFKTETVHSSGHCSVKDLIETLQKINADYIIPVHTENQESFKDLGLKGNLIFPEYGKKFII
ncbi:MAG TPA: MBL fold metallo-hydrolase RNA specificity domain-containing protein, partial [Candidatus Lokiarchaeia archaeon]